MKQTLIAIDQAVNTLIPPLTDAWADETFSSRCWRYGRDKGGGWELLRRLVDLLFWFDPQHCFMSYLSERERLQSPPEER